MSMKKLIAVLLLIVMAVTLTACGSNDSKPAPTAAPTAAPTEAPAAAASTETKAEEPAKTEEKPAETTKPKVRPAYTSTQPKGSETTTAPASNGNSVSLDQLMKMSKNKNNSEQ